MVDFEYKVGDRVRCKKFYNDLDSIKFYNGSEYIIENVPDLGFPDLVSAPKGWNLPTDTLIFIDVRLSEKSVVSKRFSYKEFYEYFCSKADIRRMKLNKIKKRK